jgi:hypothetical protein
VRAAADGFKPGLRGLNSEQLRLLAALDTAPELALGGDDQMLIERIGMGEDFHPLAAAGDHREHCGPCRYNPHIMLQLRHVFLGCRFLRERPRQHELGLEHRIAALDPAVQSGPHPAQRRMTDSLLDVGDHLPGIDLVPAPIEVLGRKPELDHEIARQVLRFNLTALFAPEPDQGGFIVAHDDPSIRAAN